MNEILKLLEQDARLTPEQISVMLNRDVDEVRAEIEQLEKTGIILGYRAVIDWDKTDREYVSAVIEIKITPQRDRGFDYIAEKIYNYPEVESLTLMSGGYDLSCVIKGRTMKEVAYFVANKLSTIDGVLSTSTHFVLRKYKYDGVVYGVVEKDERGHDFI